jgi:sterol desaturase/sphingolipid hydroxylase (fatty acid hydroxylase superfamily)
MIDTLIDYLLGPESTSKGVLKMSRWVLFGIQIIVVFLWVSGIGLLCGSWSDAWRGYFAILALFNWGVGFLLCLHLDYYYRREKENAPTE